MTPKEMQDYILEAIEIVVKEEMRKLRFNYYIEATVLSINIDSTYNVSFNNNTLPNVRAREDLKLQIGDNVLVCIVNNDFSNKFVDQKLESR